MSVKLDTNSSSKYILQMKYPSKWWQSRWREAIPLGNGITGASVYGAVWDETIMLTHTDLWWKSVTPDLPDVSYTVPQIREKLLANLPFEADRIMKEELVKKGYSPVLGTPLPLCDLKIKMSTGQGFKNYQRTLNMLKGEANVSWNDASLSYQRKCFVSYERDVFVLEITEKSGEGFSCELYLDLHELEDAQWYSQSLEEYLPRERSFRAEDGQYLSYSARNDDTTYFGAVARVISENGDCIVGEKKLLLQNVTKATIILKTFVKAADREHIAEVRQQLNAIKCGYEELLQEHKNVWEPVFTTAILDLKADAYDSSNEELLLHAYQGEASIEMLEKMWAYGRYLLLAASRTGGNPCHLYGLWCGEYQGHWSFNMANENLQMIYWQALTGNNPEVLLPVFDYFDGLMDDFRTNARNLYGCRGIFVPGPTVPGSGLIKNVSPHLLYWTGGAGWIGQHYYDYYLCTQDKEFLEKRAIPYLREVALFYEDFFVEDDQGYYMTIPSNSPENSPGNFWDFKTGMDVGMETTMNATMDFAIAKEVLSHLIEGCEVCGIETEDVEKWKKMLSKIPPYQLNEDGAVKEWMHDFFKDNYRHRHQSHLYPLFPGNEIHEETDKELYDAFVIAAKKRLEVGINQQTGWSMAHLANNYARMKESELALECLDLICRSCVMNNFMTVHNDWRQMGVGLKMSWATVQIDANMGFTAAVNEMLMQSFDNTILILPALPKRLRIGSVENLRSRQGLLVSIHWDMEMGTIEVKIRNEYCNKRVQLRLPKKFESHELDENDCVSVAQGEQVTIRGFIK